MSMVGPLGALLVGPAESTIQVEEDIDGDPPRGRCWWVRQQPPPSFEDDVDGGPPGGHYQRVRQRPPPRFKTTSMVGPLGVMPRGLAASATEFEDDVDDGLPRGRCRWIR
jgi:hypothetical protein